MTDEELQEMVDEADRDGDGEARSEKSLLSVSNFRSKLREVDLAHLDRRGRL